MILKMLAVAGAILALLLVVGKVPLSYNVRNLTLRWKTTAMTALAFTVVIGLLVVMLAFVNGMRRLTQTSGVPGNVLVLAEGATDEVFSKLTVGDLAEMEHLPGVQRDSGGAILTSRETYMVVNQPIANPQPGRPHRRFLQLRGVDDPAMAGHLHALALLPGGQWFSEAGVEKLPDGTSAVQAVLGEGVARELGRDRTAQQIAAARNADRLDVGDDFILADRPWVVVGVLASAGSSFGSEIWAKRSLAGPLFGKDAVTSLVLRTQDDAAARSLADYLNKEYKKTTVAAQVETEYYANLSETNLQFLAAIVMVTVVMAVGGVLGVMNTMFAAISQRVKDIGVLRLLGYSRRQILVCFLLESLGIALVGGLLGCGLGMLADGWTATSVITGHSGGGKSVVLQLAIEPYILAVGILLSIAMGILGGLIPALSATRLRPWKRCAEPYGNGASP